MSVDKYLQVRNIAEGSAYALGDCADVKSGGFKEPGQGGRAVQARGRGQERRGGQGRVREHPQDAGGNVPADRDADEGRADGMLHDILSKFVTTARSRPASFPAMARRDSRLASPGTAQVANQQGEYLARELNAQGRARRNGVETPRRRRRSSTCTSARSPRWGEQAALDTSVGARCPWTS